MTTALTIKTVQLPMSIVAASATIEEIQNFTRSIDVSALDAHSKKLLQYAYARAVYRAGLDLTVEQVALLCETSVSKVQHYAKRLRVAFDDLVRNNDASRIMCNMMEM